MPDIYDLIFCLLALGFVFLRIGPSMSGAIWKVTPVPPPPVVPVSRDIVRPVMTPPIYPLWAQRRGQVGWVVVDVQIGEKGQYLGHEVVAEAPPGLFTASVAKALKTTTYKSHSGFRLQPKIRTLYKFVVPARDGSVPGWAVTSPGLIVHRNRGLLD